ncbi:hypothetical protein [Hydrogenophaga sp.]|uniref:hypothetical protein n=1 Tax=Hydrogenophaga sp. TaxID=1904254 RepID=UPI002FC8CC17
MPPNPLVNESGAYVKSLAVDHTLAIKRNCISKDFIFAILERNGWALTDNVISADIDAEDGNFYFARLKDFSTVTMDDGCLVSLQIAISSPREAS